MKNFLKIFCFLCLSLFILTQSSQASELESLTEEFYGGLADIVEANIDAPDVCVSKVDSYYISNKDKIEKIKQLAAKPAQQAMGMMDDMMEKYQSMSEEDLEALEKETAQMQYEIKQTAPEAGRYTEAVSTFTRKYPEHGMRIGMKAMQLVPGLGFQGAD